MFEFIKSLLSEESNSDNSVNLESNSSESVREPIEIKDKSDLEKISEHTRKKFLLKTDIVFEDGEKFKTLCKLERNEFEGTFDGNGHKIVGLKIVEDECPCGLFGRVKGGGKIKNLHLKDVDVTGLERESGVGGLVGRLTNGIVKNCSVTGEVKGFSSVGGLVGSSHGDIQKCQANCKVNATQTAGGLVGNYMKMGSGGTKLEECFSSGEVFYDSINGEFDVSKGQRTCFGGLVGSMRGEDTVLNNNYSNADVQGHEWIGGLVGYQFKSTIKNCYAVGSVDGDKSVGDFIGLNERGDLDNTYTDNIRDKTKDELGFNDSWIVRDNDVPRFKWEVKE